MSGDLVNSVKKSSTVGLKAILIINHYFYIFHVKNLSLFIRAQLALFCFFKTFQQNIVRHVGAYET
jgi:hypothetical protein